MFRRKTSIIFSPVEIEFLTSNYSNLPLDQLCIALSKSRAALNRKIDELNLNPNSKRKQSTKTKTKNNKSKIGKRKDLNNLFLRSGWEANILRLLNYRNQKWIYEPKTFFFEGLKHGTVNYTPDIYLPEEDIWIEVKGFLKTEDKVKIRRFKKYFPEESKKLRVVVGGEKTKTAEFFIKENIPIIEYYNQLNKTYKNVIPFWE